MQIKKQAILVFLSAAALLLAACGGDPTLDPAAAVMTNAAGTVAVELTKAAEAQPTETPAPTETPTPEVTETPAITNTTGPTNTPFSSSGDSTGGSTGSTCDLAGFVADVTVPDGTDFDPGESFTKTWRLSNNGTCTWDANYTVVFADGDQMTTADTIALTSSVAPNDTVDISIDMTAPSTAGNYLGNWYLKNNTGQIFGLPGPFYVEINVTNTGGPTATLGTGTPTATPSGGSGSSSVTLSTNAKGSVNDDNTVTGNAYTGDDVNDNGQQAFVSFDISVIPSNATIDKVTVDFSSFDTLSNPFGAIGCLNGFPGNFFPLSAGEYISGGAPGGALAVWCDSGSLSTASSNDAIKNHLQSILGSSEFQLRLMFSSETDSDSAADMVRLTNPKLIIEYTVP